MEEKKVVEDIRKQAETCILKTYKMVEQHLNVKGSPESSIREIKLLAKNNLTKIKKLSEISIASITDPNKLNKVNVKRVSSQVIALLVKLEKDLRNIIKRRF